MGKIYTSVEQLIGGTPLLELTRITKQEGLQATLLAGRHLAHGLGHPFPIEVEEVGVLLRAQAAADAALLDRYLHRQPSFPAPQRLTA